MTRVNWEAVLDRLDDDLIEEAVKTYEWPVSAMASDTEQETCMNGKHRRTSKKLLTIAVAAAMVMALAITGFATGVLPSVFARLATGDGFYELAGELSDKNRETVEPNTEQVISLTKEESYYDGENLVLAYSLDTEKAVVTFDFGPEHEAFENLFTPPEYNSKELAQIWYDHDLPEADLLKAQAQLLKNGAVGFTVRYAGIGDHVQLADGTDLGPMCGGQVDGTVILRNQDELPAQAQNQAEIAVQLGVKQYVAYYYAENGVVSYYCPVAEAEWVPFTLQNVNN